MASRYGSRCTWFIRGYRTHPVTYTRIRQFDGAYQDCQVIIEPDSEYAILLPGDGSEYSVKRVGVNNKINDEKTEDNTHACIICQEYVKIMMWSFSKMYKKDRGSGR